MERLPSGPFDDITLAADGHLGPSIAQTFGLNDAAAAHVAMNAVGHVGKLIIDL